MLNRGRKEGILIFHISKFDSVKYFNMKVGLYRIKKKKKNEKVIEYNFVFLNILLQLVCCVAILL